MNMTYLHAWLSILFFCSWSSVYSLDTCVSNIDISTCATPCIVTCSSGLISRSNYGIIEYNEAIINIGPGYILTLNISALNTEANYDSITVISCDSVSSCVNMLGSYSGNSLPTTYPQSRTGIMKIVWNSDFLVSGGSWKASYFVDVMPPAPLAACTQNLDIATSCTSNQPCIITCTSGTISAPTSLGLNTNQMHVIISSTGNVGINFVFTALSTGLSGVNVEALSCNTTGSCLNSIASYSGELSANVKAFPSSFGKLKLIHYNNILAGFKGWAGNYYATRLDNNNYYLPGAYIVNPAQPCSTDLEIKISACNPCIVTCRNGTIYRGAFSAGETYSVIINIGNNAVIHFAPDYYSISIYNFLEFYSCTSTSSCTTLIGKYSEYTRPDLYAAAGPTSSTGIMKIIWNPISSGSSGWKGRYSVSQTTTPCPAGQFFPTGRADICLYTLLLNTDCRPASQCIMTNCRSRKITNIPKTGNYGLNENFKLYIAPVGATSVTFALTSLFTEPTADFIRISSCISGTQICTVMVNSISGLTLPASPITSTTGAMLIEWFSDGNNNYPNWGSYTGWTATFSSEIVDTCLNCPAGAYASGTGFLLCSSCVAGKYSSLIGSVSSGSCTACSVGNYSLIGSSTCNFCKAGSYSSDKDQTKCSLCSAGTYSTSIGSSICTICQPGTYSTSLGSIITCTACPAGSYSSVSGANDLNMCIGCLSGKYSQLQGMNSSAACIPCKAGNYSESYSYPTECTKCPMGTYNPVSGKGGFRDSCLYCPSGYYGIKAGGINSSEACSACPIGKYGKQTMPSCTSNDVYYSNGGTFQSACRSGTITMYGMISSQTFVYTIYSPGQITASLLSINNVLDSDIIINDGIPTGQTFFDGYATYPILTGNQLAYYVPGNWNGGCCPNPVTSSTGTLTIVFATPLEEPGINWQMQFTTDGLPQSTCFFCQPGSYNDITGTFSSVCTLCPRGSYGTAIGANSSAQCPLCQPGNYSANGAVKCDVCPSGTYATGYGTQSTCPQCVVGAYSTNMGATSSISCIPCKAGTFSIISPVSQCTLCQPGSFGTSIGSNSSKLCTLCQPGSFSTLLGSNTSCPLCTSGTFSSLLGSNSNTSCSQCVAGTFSTFQGSNTSATCMQCTAGTFSTVLGANSPSICILCNSGTFNAVWGSNKSSACVQCRAGTFSSNLGSSECLLCTFGTYGPGSQNCSLCPKGTYGSKSGQYEIGQCSSCLPGSYATGMGSANCTLCPSFSYATGIGSTNASDCSQCNAGSINKTQSHSLCAICNPCKTCPPGSTSSGKPCYTGSVLDTVSCICNDENTYFDGSKCIPCRRCHTNATTLTWCVKGSTSDTTLCKCNPNFYGDGVTSCTPCPTCHFTQYLPRLCSNDVRNPNSLLSCSCIAGTFSNTTNATSCTQCGSAFYQPAYGASSCIACPIGKNSTVNKGQLCA